MIMTYDMIRFNEGDHYIATCDWIIWLFFEKKMWKERLAQQN